MDNTSAFAIDDVGELHLLIASVPLDHFVFRKNRLIQKNINRFLISTRTTRMPDIYAAGFNAHNQLNLATVGNNEDAPEDIRTLTKITEEANGSAKVLFAGWSSTVRKSLHLLDG